MNLVLIHLGGEIPSYFWTTLSQVKKCFTGNIYTITPEWDDRLDGTKWTRQSSLAENKELNEFNSVSWMKEIYGDFWSVTFARLYYLEALMKRQNLSEVVHIENDVLIYTDFAKIPFKKVYEGKVAVNPIGEKYDAFACVYVDSWEPMHKLNQELLRLLALGNNYLMELIGESMVNEMLLLRLISKLERDYIAYLPSLPENYIPELGYLFDPASYGQFIGGTGSNNTGWTGDHHYIGRAINENKISVFPKLSELECPVVVDKDGNYPIANLHIHSKELHKYV